MNKSDVEKILAITKDNEIQLRVGQLRLITPNHPSPAPPNPKLILGQSTWKEKKITHDANDIYLAALTNSSTYGTVWSSECVLENTGGRYSLHLSRSIIRPANF